MEFTPSQQRAIGFARAKPQLIACAGSGRTEVVEQGVAHLLWPESGGLAPRNIIAFTFTEKAAAELKEQIVNPSGTFLGLAMYVGTIHAFSPETTVGWVAPGARVMPSLTEN